MRRFVGIILIIILCCLLLTSRYTLADKQEEVEEEKIEVSSAITTVPEPESLPVYKPVAKDFIRNVEYTEPTDKEQCTESIEELTQYQTELQEAETIVEATEDQIVITEEETKVQGYIDQYNDDLNEFERWEARSAEYPAATQIWLYLSDVCGFNDAVCAGILGNIMAEVGGQTLYIQYWLGGYNTGYYGMCQWALCFRPEAYGLDLYAQCELLANTMEFEINSFGSCYYSGFDYNAFLSMTNPSDVALAFAKTYERCSSASYYIRQVNAQVAYDYFVDGEAA